MLFSNAPGQSLNKNVSRVIAYNMQFSKREPHDLRWKICGLQE